MERILKLAERLRSPGGCPWDREQSLASIVDCLRKETEELAEAIAKGDAAHVREELGDCLWNVAFLVYLAEEKGMLSRDEPVMGIVEKLVRRHPHVFGAEKAATAEEALEVFNRQKEKERQTKPGTRDPEPGS